MDRHVLFSEDDARFAHGLSVFLVAGLAPCIGAMGPAFTALMIPALIFLVAVLTRIKPIEITPRGFVIGGEEVDFTDAVVTRWGLFHVVSGRAVFWCDAERSKLLNQARTSLPYR